MLISNELKLFSVKLKFTIESNEQWFMNVCISMEAVDETIDIYIYTEVSCKIK